MLVTGFFDWLDLGVETGERSEHRLRDNPSGRLIQSADGHPGSGPLAVLLDEAWRDRVDVDVAFEVLPVRWGVGAPLHRRPLDLIVHLGWGRQVPADALWLELDAYDGREGVDVSGLARSDVIDADEARSIRAAPRVRGAMLDLASQDASTFGAHRAVVMPARASNAFVCNETHALGLLARRRAAAEGREAPLVWFVHVPTAGDAQLETLAVAIRELLSWTVGVTRRSSADG